MAARITEYSTVGRACTLALLSLVLATGPAPPAAADLAVSAWMVVLHDADTEAAAEAWAESACGEAALAPLCNRELDGALEPGVAVREARFWTGLEGGPWVVVAAVVRSRAGALELFRTLEAANLTPRLARIREVPGVQQWGRGIADQWRVWTIQGPEGTRQVLYLSRDGQADVELARGWPLPRSNTAELYPIGPGPEGDEYYFFFDGAARVLHPESATVERVVPSGIDAQIAARDAAAQHIPNVDLLRVEWALPFAAAVTAPAGTALDGDGAPRRRFLLLRRRGDGWRVVRDEVQVGPAVGDG